MGKRERLASIIVGITRWLSARSDRVKLLSHMVVERLFLTDQMEMPSTRHRFPPEELAARTEAFNEASERYFADYEDRTHLLGKPFSDRTKFARRLFDIGVLAHWLRLSPGEVVAELGAGTCWLPHLLNRFGCRTIAIDISPTALEIGRELFTGDPHTNWDLDPQFIAYDGHHLPLPDASVDKVLLYDAFHHIPNQDEMLRELSRILKPGGLVAMCEPGREHGHSETSRLEMDEWGVLENDIYPEELGRRARQCGFDQATVVPINLPLSVEIPTDRLRDFLRGRELRHYWSQWGQAIQDVTYLLLYKGTFVPTTRNPHLARARIEPQPTRLRVAPGQIPSLEVTLTNVGDTRWLHDLGGDAGHTRLGGHLHGSERGSPALDYDWYRGDLPRDVGPGEEVVLQVHLPPLDTPGQYRVVFDVVAEQVLWFANRDSIPAELHLEVDGTG